jgi:hypothetical protein
VSTTTRVTASASPRINQPVRLLRCAAVSAMPGDASPDAGAPPGRTAAHSEG